MQQMANPFMVASHVAFEKWLSVHRPDVVFDIGANEGGYIELWLHHGAKRVVAFEPLPMYAEKIRIKFAGDARIETHQIALGERLEHRSGLSVLNGWTLADKDSTNLEPDPRFVGQKFEVSFNFLDSGLFGVPDFVKLDADGYEPAILRGAKRLLTQERPAIMLELSYLPKALGDSCEEMIRNLYVDNRYVIMSADGSFVCRDHKEMMQYFPWHTSFDVLAIPEEKA